MSSSAISGPHESAVESTSSPRATWAMTSISGSRLSRLASAPRTIAWSSAIKTLITAPPAVARPRRCRGLGSGAAAMPSRPTGGQRHGKPEPPGGSVARLELAVEGAHPLGEAEQPAAVVIRVAVSSFAPAPLSTISTAAREAAALTLTEQWLELLWRITLVAPSRTAQAKTASTAGVEHHWLGAQTGLRSRRPPAPSGPRPAHRRASPAGSR